MLKLISNKITVFPSCIRWLLSKFLGYQKTTFLIVYLFTFIGIVIAESNLQQQLMEDIQDERLDEFSLVQAAFILSGADREDSLHYAIMWYDSLLENIEGFHFDLFDRIGTASKVFSYLHSTWLITYREKATTLTDIIRKKEYNCVAGTILYNLICSDLGLPTAAFETPTHVYTIFTDFSNRVMVENTSSMGFDIMNNLQAYSRYLAQFYPREKIYKIGLDRLYAYENSNGREINNVELLGLLAYNRAYFAKKQGDYGKAYEYVHLAQNFNRDSRSNVDFEIDLYYRWGKVLFKRGRFTQTFNLYTDAYERYPFNNDFAQNCEISFANAIMKNWQIKNWGNTQKLVNKVMPLDVLSEKTWNLLQKTLLNWERYSEKVGNQELKDKVKLLTREYFGID